MKKIKTIWLISDGIPGHLNQALGLTETLQEIIGATSLHCIDATLKRKWLRPLLGVAINANNLSASERLTKLAYGIVALPDQRPDLIISAGGNTSFINALFGKRYQCPCLFIGSLRKLQADCFTAVLTLEAIPEASNNIVMEIPPTRITPEKAAQAGVWITQHSNQAPEYLWGMIIGGEGAGFTYGEQDWKALAEAMVSLSQSQGIKWLITTSRRTGIENEKILKAAIPENIIEKAVWYNHQPEKTMLAFLGASSRVFCTADSMSMIAESVSAGSTVTVLTPKQSNPNEKYENALQSFVSKGFIQLTPITQVEQSCANPVNSNHAKLSTQATLQKLVEKLNIVEIP
ncbi:MAG: mitochondrial fission ELM1 family protein [Hahellaceae bacterium]|nr:mitochondrial fission ELM1 family protein [Hahellaceae bacterium]MCP5210558.1 mitochondrial fission ELM1 family protein [Hahellaceae bacterium]